MKADALFKTCGSGISPKGLDVLKALGARDVLLADAYWIRGLRLVTPGDRELFLSAGDETTAVICCRRILDQRLLSECALDGDRRSTGQAKSRRKASGVDVHQVNRL